MALQGRREREERQEKEAVKLNSNISKIKIQALFGYGALPHRPTKGLSERLRRLFGASPFGNLRAQILRIILEILVCHLDIPFFV